MSARRLLTALLFIHMPKPRTNKAACALHFAYYNFCRTHKGLRVKPALEAGVTDRIWTPKELLSV